MSECARRAEAAVNADLSHADAERVSQVPPTPHRPLERDWAHYCHEVTREAALGAVREDEDDEQ